jgi:SAM-dependent methyltransferase
MSPSAWVTRWAGLIPTRGRVLDLACGSGRHAVYLSGLGHEVDALDIDLSASASVRASPGVSWREVDLERGDIPFDVAAYDAIVVVNYLHRPLLPRLFSLSKPGAVMIYETFANGQQAFGRPRNPAYLLMPGELLELARGHLRVVAYEDVLETMPAPARVQRICAIAP